MTAGPLDSRRPTALAHLFGNTDTAAALAGTLDRRGVTGSVAAALGGLSRAGRQVAGAQVAVVTAGLLDLDLFEVLLAAWRKHADLTAAAHRTQARPGSREVVDLVAHQVTSTHEPYVDLYVDDQRVSRVHFRLSLEFVVQAVVGTVGDGRLLDVAAGHCDVAVTLLAEERLLVSRRGRIDLPGIIPLGAGFALVDPLPGAGGASVAASDTSPVSSTRTTPREG